MNTTRLAAAVAAVPAALLLILGGGAHGLGGAVRGRSCPPVRRTWRCRPASAAGGSDVHRGEVHGWADRMNI